jgi:hypothetical protein
MPLEDYGLDLPTLEVMYSEWKVGGRSKSAIERRYIGKSTHHGKLFTKLVREYLHLETERTSSLKLENQRLRSLLQSHGINPDAEEGPSSREESEE